MKKLWILFLFLSIHTTTYAAINPAPAPKPVLMPEDSRATLYTIGTIDFVSWSGSKTTTPIIENAYESDVLTYEKSLMSLWRQGGIKQITHINGIPIENTRWANYGGTIPKQGEADGIPPKVRYSALPIYLNGYPISTDDIPPYVDPASGKTMISVRLIHDMFSIAPVWHSIPNTVTMDIKGKDVVLTIGSKSAKVNQVEQILEAPVTITNDYIYVPLTFVTQQYGAKVEWKNGTIHVTTTFDRNKRHFTNVVTTDEDKEVLCDFEYISYLYRVIGLTTPGDAMNYAKSRMGIHETCKPRMPIQND